tara:strand:- start:111 stop:572 length:462 start_codon:yes stop_codon:yes gene_type:complete
MKLSNKQIKKIIKEEISKFLNETRLEHRFRFEPKLPKGIPEIYAEKINTILNSGLEGSQQALIILSGLIDEKEAEEYVYEKLVIKFFKENAGSYKLKKDHKGFHLYILGKHDTTGLSVSVPAKTLPHNIPAKEMYEEVMDLDRMKGFYSHFNM